MRHPQAGDRISNYLLEAPVGCGSFGEVWKARHHVLAETVAIKIPTDPQYVRNLQREGVTVHGLRHPNIVRVIDLDPYGDPPYLVMEFVDGISLRQMIDAHPSGMPIDASVAILDGILSALKCAHDAGVIHRDVKPANVLVARGHDLSNMTPDRVKVTDFGLGQVRRETCASMMQSGSLLTEEGRSIAGTMAYMAPEQRDGRELDARCDLYAAGVVLFEMLVGDRPQGNDLPSHTRRDVPAAIDELFQRCYTRVDRRFASADDALTMLRASRSSRMRIPPPPPPRRAARADAGRACPNCSQATEPEDYFCIMCGHQLVSDIPRCPTCHAFAQRADNYCILCGTKLRHDMVTRA